MALRTINRVTLLGRAGKDPVTRQTPGGVPFAAFSLATNERWKGADGEWQERTDWHNVSAWRTLAEYCEKHIRKGTPVLVEGRLQSRSYEDKEGQMRYVTEVIADTLHVVESYSSEQAGSLEASEADQPASDLPF